MITKGDIRAELLIQQRDEFHDNYYIRKEGRFYDGYNSDIIETTDATEKRDFDHCIRLSRDGIMNSLPEGLFFDENEFLKKEYNTEQIKELDNKLHQQRSELKAFFSAFDNIFFKGEQQLHQCINAIECERDIFVLKHIYGNDPNRQKNRLVQKLLRAIIDTDILKGNLTLLPILVRSILDVDTYCYIDKKVVDNNDNSLCYTVVKFVLVIENLTNIEYNKMMHDYEEFFSWLEDLFLPYDCELDYCIKDYKQPFLLQDQITLDYNTQL